jgi:hypothetical protein
MKVSLEFEESDLKEMLTSYFRGNGFAVKNLDEVCMQFLKAYPDGLQVQAEIIPMEATAAPAAEPRSHHVDAQPEYEDERDATDADEVMSTDSVLTLNDLMDPEPRKGRLVSVVNTSKDEFTDLLNKSKRIENERRRT